MPPHNNPAEPEMRDGVAGQRNVRHQTTAPDGREIFSRLTTFAITCRKNGMLPCRAVVEMARNPEWNMFKPGPQAGREWCVFDSPAAELVRPPGAGPPLAAEA